VRPGCISLSLVAATVLTAAAPPPPNAAEGRWLTEKQDGIVEVFRCAGTALCGRLAWLRLPPDAGNPEGTDDRNPSPALRTRPLCGLLMMGGFTPDGPGAWHDGWVYDPASGKTYNATMAVEPDGRLELRGYVGIPLFGESQLWTRFTGPTPPCPGR
jgi:uncharacterized protein (DUF2147 family)